MYTESRKMVRWTYLQGRNGEADVENGLMDPGREGEDGTS